MEKAGSFGVPKQIFAGDTGTDFFKTHKTGTVPGGKNGNYCFSIHGKWVDNGGTAETNASL